MILVLSLSLIIIFSTELFAESNWRFVPSLVLSETYNSNINSGADEVEDYITKVGANLGALYSGPDVGFRANYLADLNVFARSPELNVVTQDGSINVDLNRWFRKYFKDAEMNITEEFTVTPELRDYYFDEERERIGALSSYGVRTGRSDSYGNAFSLESRHPLSRRQSINIGYSNRLTEYKDPALIDNVTHSISAGTSYSLARDVVSFDIRFAVTRADGADSNIYSSKAGIIHSYSPRTSLDLNVGLDALDHERLNNIETTIKGALRLSSRSRLFTWNGGYQRELNPSSGISPVPTVAQIFYINIGGTHSRNLTSNLGADYAVNKSTTTAGNDIDTQSYNLSARLSYRFRPWLQGTLSASHFYQNSETPAATDIRRNLFMSQLSATFL